jgi:RNA polymerase sigma-70 factor (ECF subfamily)
VGISSSGVNQLDFPFYAPVDDVSTDPNLVRSANEVVALYDSLRLPLFRYLISMGASAENAEDVVQETFLRVYRHLIANGSGHDSNLRAWAFRVAHNLAINHNKIRERTRAWLGDDCDGQSLTLAHPTASPHELLTRKERLQQLATAMATLSKRERHCLHLRAEGLRYAEIAVIVGISVSTVAETLNRALKKLAG